MADEIKVGTEGAASAAETSGQESAPHGVAAAEGTTGEESFATFTDTADTSATGGQPRAADGGDDGAKRRNAEQARRRREAERARAIEDARREAIIDALDGKNPYTGRPMKDADDVAEFLAMREIEKKGGDPVTDYSEHLTARAREERLQREEREREEAWFVSDREAFAEKYPDVKLDELISDEAFADYADGKVGKKPLAEIYEGYLRQSARFEERARTRAAQAAANREASPGALGTAGTSDTGFYTREQVQAMSLAEVQRNLTKINESMKHWK
ncbi:MAG: hypothetical protein IJC99_04195 [Clostridia bacterium]|nr:hypothetical protein [Clostridia bacterium]